MLHNNRGGRGGHGRGGAYHTGHKNSRADAFEKEKSEIDANIKSLMEQMVSQLPI